MKTVAFDEIIGLVLSNKCHLFADCINRSLDPKVCDLINMRFVQMLVYHQVESTELLVTMVDDGEFEGKNV